MKKPLALVCGAAAWYNPERLVDKSGFDEGENDMSNIVVEWYEDKKNVDEMQNWNPALKEWEQSVISFFHRVPKY